MDKEALQQRTKQFALRVIQLVNTLPKTKTGDVIGRQLLRSATSVGANYRSAYRARSRADFISKIGIVEEEADETLYWLELILEAGLLQAEGELKELLQEADELTAIFVTTGRTARKNR